MSYTWECMPPERADAVAANKILIPEKSRHMYEQAYRHYREYCRERKITRGAHYAQENLFKYISALLDLYATTTPCARVTGRLCLYCHTVEKKNFRNTMVRPAYRRQRNAGNF